MNKIFRGVAQFKKILGVDNRHINKMGLTIILILDLFILKLLFSGLDQHSDQLTSASQYLPYTVRQVFISKSWQMDNWLDKLQLTVLNDSKSIKDLEKMHPLAKEFYSQVQTIVEDQELLEKFEQRRQLSNQLDTKVEEYRKRKSIEDSLADPEIIKVISQQNQQTKQLYKKLLAIEQQIKQDDRVKNLEQFIKQEQKDLLAKDLKHFNFWFPVREFFWQALFLIPVFGFFCWWSLRSVRKNRQTQTLVAAHLVVVAAIPIILKLTQLFLELIPDHLFIKLRNLLMALKLIAIWHYLIIFLAVGFALWLIFFVQSDLFKDIVVSKKLRNGECLSCGKKVRENAAYCINCGAAQFTKCRSCGELTNVGSKYCAVCGKVIKSKKIKGGQ